MRNVRTALWVCAVAAAAVAWSPRPSLAGTLDGDVPKVLKDAGTAPAKPAETPKTPRDETTRPPPGDQKAPGRAEGPAAPPEKTLRSLTADQVVSEKALFYLDLRSKTQTAKSFARTALASLLGEDEIKRQVGDAIGKFKRAYVRGDGTLPESVERRRQEEVDLIEKALGTIDREFCLAIESDAADASKINWMLVSSAEDPDKVQDLLDLMERFRTSQLTDPNNIDDDFVHGSYSVHALENRERKTYEAWAAVENLLIYARGRGVVEAAIDRYRKQGAGTLSTSAAYTLPFRQVGRDADVYMQVSVGALRALGKTVVDEQLLGLLSSAGIEDNTPSGDVAAAVGISFVSDATEPGKGAIRENILVRRFKAGEPAAAERVEAITAKCAPVEALYFECCQGKLSDLVPVFAASKPGSAKLEFKDMARTFFSAPLSLVARTAGWHMLRLLRECKGVQDQAQLKRMMEPFRGEMGASVTFVPGNPAERAIEQVHFMEIDVNNIEGYNETIRSLAEASGFPWRTRTVENVTITFISGTEGENLPPTVPGAHVGFFEGLTKKAKAEEKPGEPPKAEPARLCFFSAFATLDIDKRKFLIASDSIRAVQKAIQQRSFTKSSLAAKPEFQKMLGQFPDSRVHVTYIDLPRIVNILYEAVLPKMAGVSMDLPPPETFTSHLFGVGIATVPAESGVLIGFHSPVGTLTMVGVVGSLAYPLMQKSHAQAVSTMVDENLRRIGVAIYLYASDFDRFPQALSDLYPKYVKDLKTFESPLKPDAVRVAADIDDPAKTNLKYVPGRTLQDLSDEILLYEIAPTGFKIDLTGELTSAYHYLQLNCRVDIKSKSYIERRLAGTADPTGSKRVMGGGGAAPAPGARPVRRNK